MGKSFVGIDVSQDRLDVYVRPLGENWSVPNTPQGRALLVESSSQGSTIGFMSQPLADL